MYVRKRPEKPTLYSVGKTNGGGGGSGAEAGRATWYFATHALDIWHTRRHDAR